MIERRRGDTTPDVCTVTLSSTKGSANLTGCTFEMLVSSEPYPADTSTLVYKIKGTVTDVVEGVVEFSPTADQADRTGYFYYEIKMVDSYGRVFTPLSGSYVYR